MSIQDRINNEIQNISAYDPLTPEERKKFIEMSEEEQDKFLKEVIELREAQAKH